VGNQEVVMITVAELLEGHVGLEIESLDRIYLNGYVPTLQVGGQVANFMMRHLGFPIPSPAILAFTTFDEPAVTNSGQRYFSVPTEQRVNQHHNAVDPSGHFTIAEAWLQSSFCHQGPATKHSLLVLRWGRSSSDVWGESADKAPFSQAKEPQHVSSLHPGSHNGDNQHVIS
jgi:hypothetical protein